MTIRICGAATLFVTVVLIVTLTDTARGVGDRAPLPQQVRTPQARAQTYQDVYNGWKWWHVYCYRCHGVDAIGSPTAPNLTDPSRKLTSAAFLKIVRDGVPDKGMQAWNKLLDNKQIAQIHLYVRARTDKVLPPGRPDEVGPNGSTWNPPEGWPGR
jgi:mono/diheme cytochrome c family protein